MTASPEQRINDPSQAWDIAYAVKHNGMDELFAAGAGELTPQQIFVLGMRAGAAALQAELAASPAERPGQPETEYAGWEDITNFAREHDYSNSMPRRLRTCLQSRRLALNGSQNRQTLIDNILVDRDGRPLRGSDSRAVDVRLDLVIAKSLVAEIVTVNGYKREAEYPTVKGMGVQTSSFLADFVNHSLSLPEEERFPLHVQRPVVAGQ